MRIVNLIHIGDQVLSLDDMDPMKKAEIALRLNEQSLKTLGYAAKKEKKQHNCKYPCPVRGVFPTPHSPFTQLACVSSPPLAGHHVEGMGTSIIL